MRTIQNSYPVDLGVLGSHDAEVESHPREGSIIAVWVHLFGETRNILSIMSRPALETLQAEVSFDNALSAFDGDPDFYRDERRAA